MSKKAIEDGIWAIKSALANLTNNVSVGPWEDALRGLEEALAKQEHEWVRGECVKCGASIEQEQGEPVAWELGAEVYWGDSPEISDYVRKEGTPLYTTPQQRKPPLVLSEEEMYILIKRHLGLERRRDSTVIDQYSGRFTDAARYFNLMDAAIEAAHGIKE